MEVPSAANDRGDQVKENALGNEPMGGTFLCQKKGGGAVCCSGSRSILSGITRKQVRETSE